MTIFCILLRESVGSLQLPCWRRRFSSEDQSCVTAGIEDRTRQTSDVRYTNPGLLVANHHNIIIRPSKGSREGKQYRNLPFVH